MRPSHITVTAPEGRLTPIHPDDGVEPGGHLMYVRAGHVRRVALSMDVRRYILDEDLIPCKPDGTPCSIDDAAAPEDIQHSPPFIPVGAEIHLARTRPAQPAPALTDAESAALKRASQPKGGAS
jgi:hypothetical protein